MGDRRIYDAYIAGRQRAALVAAGFAPPTAREGHGDWTIVEARRV